jgi:hypothetical protein
VWVPNRLSACLSICLGGFALLLCLQGEGPKEMFWELMEKFTHEERGLVLKFATGRIRCAFFSVSLSLPLPPPPPALRSRAPSAHDVTDLLTACVRGWCVRVCAQVACQPADFMERRRRRAMPDGGDVLPGAVPAALLLRRDYGAPSALRSGQLHVHRHGLSSCSLACWSSEECTELIAPVAATYVVIRIHSDLNPESQTDLRLRS